VALPEEFAGWTTRDLFGGTGFPDIGPDGALELTLGSRDFFWLALAPQPGGDHG
jgi:maltose alpha-D-glucosyltransferase/alpha-amylase